MKYVLYPGRWQCIPPHAGHLALFDVARQEGKNILIGVRDTEQDDSNPYTVEERMEALKKAVPDAKIMVIPDIEGVYYGRAVGFNVKEIKLDKKTEAISGTKMREANGLG